MINLQHVNSAAMQTERWRLKWDRTELCLYSGKFVCATLTAITAHVLVQPKIIGPEIDERRTNKGLSEECLESSCGRLKLYISTQ